MLKKVFGSAVFGVNATTFCAFIEFRPNVLTQSVDIILNILIA